MSSNNTVKPVCIDDSRDQVIVVSVDRWSLYGGALVQLRWTMSQPTVVFKTVQVLLYVLASVLH